MGIYYTSDLRGVGYSYISPCINLRQLEVYSRESAEPKSDVKTLVL